jgi:pimeloyl-ACP methyl ester carboxylesterase
MTTYVLIHGSFQGGWIWKPTARLLMDSGHSIYTPTLEGCGERSSNIREGITIVSQAKEMSDFLFYQDLCDVVLVATSTGGLVVCKVAAMVRDRVKKVVFVDALAPQPGQRVNEIVIQDPNASQITTALARGPSKEDLEKRLFADFDQELKEWAIDRVTMHPIDASDAAGELDEFWSQAWDATVIRCTKSVNPSESHQRETAKALNAEYHELNSGHYPMLTHPEELSGILRSLQ